MVEGKNDFESVGEKRGSLFFREAFGLPYVYAKDTVRLYIEKMACIFRFKMNTNCGTLEQKCENI
jgi:hypothetical protein